MVWIKGYCEMDSATLRRVLRPGNGRRELINMRSPNSINLCRKWCVPPRTTLAGLGEEIKRELIAENLRPGWVIGFSLCGVDGGGWGEFIEGAWGAAGGRLATDIAAEQQGLTVRWFLRPAAGLDELEERVAHERLAWEAERDRRFAGVGDTLEERRQRDEARAEARRREEAERGDPIAEAPRLAALAEPDPRDIERAVAASLAPACACARHQVPHGVRNHRAELSEQGRYEAEPEPEPEPMEPVWLQEAASSSACAAA